MVYTSGIRRERSRRRKQLIWRMSVGLFVAAGLLFLGYSAYQTGAILAQSRVTELARDVSDLTAQRDTARAETAGLQSSLAEAKRSNLELQNRYDADVPKGEIAAVVAIARERLGQGLPAQRLAQAMRDAAATRACEAGGTRRRFAVQPAGRAPAETASLLDGLVQVSATIPSANADPARSAAVAVTLARATEPLKMTGLPARQDITINNLVLHLTVEASEVSGYAVATLSTCSKG